MVIQPRLLDARRWIFSSGAFTQVMPLSTVPLPFDLAIRCMCLSELTCFKQKKAWELQLSHFPLHPKLHAFHEIGHELLRQARVAPFCVNPASHCCSMDEDFIGRCASVSRCVSPRLIAKRTLQRYLCHIQIVWARGSWKGDWVAKACWNLMMLDKGDSDNYDCDDKVMGI